MKASDSRIGAKLDVLLKIGLTTTAGHLEKISERTFSFSPEENGGPHRSHVFLINEVLEFNERSWVLKDLAPDGKIPQKREIEFL